MLFRFWLNILLLTLHYSVFYIKTTFCKRWQQAGTCVNISVTVSKGGSSGYISARDHCVTADVDWHSVEAPLLPSRFLFSRLLHSPGLVLFSPPRASCGSRFSISMCINVGDNVEEIRWDNLVDNKEHYVKVCVWLWHWRTCYYPRAL